MSRYTTMLRFPIEQTLVEKHLSVTDEKNWVHVYDLVGLADYPIFDERYRSVLNNRIIRHYWLREIGLETVSQFRWYMRAKMHEIMPYYNRMYLAQDMIKDPMLGFWKNRDEKHDSTNDVHSNGESDTVQNVDYSVNTSQHSESTTVDHSSSVFQDTPMSMLTSDSPNLVEQLKYATTVTYDDSNSSTTSDTSTQSTSEADTVGNSKTSSVTNSVYDATDGIVEKGSNKSQAKLFEEYKKAIINIDMEIIEELNELFFGLW